MTKLETDIKTVLQQLKDEVASETRESRRRYFNQMLELAGRLQIIEPCQKLYDAFIADDHDSEERHSLHVRCVRLLDAVAYTNAKDEQGIYFNERPMPGELEVQEFFNGRRFPLSEDVCVDHLIVKAKIEMQYLNLSSSTMGQYWHSWNEIRRYCNANNSLCYDVRLIHRFINEITEQYHAGYIKEWKWKINRKAAYVLMEVAETGHFRWKPIQKDISCSDHDIEEIRKQYSSSLTCRNLSKATIGLHDYVFRRAIEFCRIKTAEDLLCLSPEHISLAICKFAEVCNRRSMATILPILRSLLHTFHHNSWVKRDLSGIVMSGFVQRGSVAAYISDKDEESLLNQLDQECKRSKAIVLLALRLGLRDCDISNLTFNEIDWISDHIRLIQIKTKGPLVLPLLPDVGNALMDYIINERPQRQDHYPYIFLRKQAPYNKLSSVYPTCSQILEKLKIKPINGNGTGVHLFRYSMVHKLLAAKVPHQVITDALGHSSKESDKPYLSMEKSMLKLCALDLSVIDKISWEVAR